MTDNTAIIKTALKHWDLDTPEILEQFNIGSPRLIFRIRTGEQDYLLKGLPCNISEATAASNVQAHLFLGNKKGMAPKLYPTRNAEFYINCQGYWFYLMEYIDGRSMEETPEDLYKIGQAAKKLHALQGYHIISPDSQKKERFYTWFRKHSFVKEFDAILDALPDFETLDQCFVHTDIGPHNTMLRQDGETVFIDLDDSGIGSRYLELGWPFIMQFVDFNHATGEMNYRFDLAESFLRGYFGESKIARNEYDLIFSGAIQMHISYMQSYGPDAVDSLWKILLFGMEQKEPLWELMQKPNQTNVRKDTAMELKSNFNPLTAIAAHENTILAAPVLPKDMLAPFNHAWGYLDKPGEMERHRHPKEEVYFFFKGEGFVFVDGEEIPVKPGDVVRIPCDALHTVINRQNEELLWAALWWTEAADNG